MNRHAVAAIYKFEMARFRRTLWQSLATPVITTALYFVVFGAAIGSRMVEIRKVMRRQPDALNRSICSMQSRGEPSHCKARPIRRGSKA